EVEMLVMRLGLWRDRLSLMRFGPQHDTRSWQERVSETWKELWRNEERDFSPYLEILMSLVFDAAQLDPNVTRLVTI
ncbi:unnamed protein product, partial [Ilex paraguariensis]